MTERRTARPALAEKPEMDWKKLLKQFQSYIALIAIFAIASLICVNAKGRNTFLDINNFMNVLRAVSENGIIAIGMTMIILLGDIDLSVGSVVGLVSTGSAALMVNNGLPFIPTVALSLGIGLMYGPISPVTKYIGNTDAITVRVASIVGFPTSLTAVIAACNGGSFLILKCLCMFSTTIIESSITSPVTNTNANSVILLSV